MCLIQTNLCPTFSLLDYGKTLTSRPPVCPHSRQAPVWGNRVHLPSELDSHKELWLYTETHSSRKLRKLRKISLHDTWDWLEFKIRNFQDFCVNTLQTLLTFFVCLFYHHVEKRDKKKSLFTLHKYFVHLVIVQLCTSFYNVIYRQTHSPVLWASYWPPHRNEECGPHTVPRSRAPEKLRTDNGYLCSHCCFYTHDHLLCTRDFIFSCKKHLSDALACINKKRNKAMIYYLFRLDKNFLIIYWIWNMKKMDTLDLKKSPHYFCISKNL